MCNSGSNTLTSFSNPNYGLDAINSNLFVTSSYGDDGVTDDKSAEDNGVTEVNDGPRPQKDNREQGTEDTKRPRTTSEEDESEDTEGQGRDRGQEIEDGVSQKVCIAGNANETGETNTTTTIATTTTAAKTTNLKAEGKGQR